MKLLREIVENTKPVSIMLFDCLLFNDTMLLSEAVSQIKPPKKTKEDKLNTHIDHLEDILIRDGKEGWDIVERVLSNTFKFVRSGKREKGFGISTKIDGSPSLVIGSDPKDGRFFVGTKSFFNKTPKINYTEEDINTNHSGAGGLQRKLKHALEHLPKVTPKVGIFQGDMIFSDNDKIDTGDGNISFQPNTLTYTHPLLDEKGKPHKEGERIKNAKMGFAPHTEYKQIGDGEMQAHFNNPIGKFNTKHPDVYLMDTKIKGDGLEISPSQSKQFQEYMKRARTAHKELLKVNGYFVIRDHEQLLLAYVNNCIKERRDPDPAGYAAWVEGRYKERASKLKMASGKNRVKSELDSALNDLMESKKTLSALFKLQNMVGKAKNILIDCLSKASKFKHSYQGKPSKAEGFVVVQDGRPIKLVDRHHFSAANFEWNQKVNPEDNPMVLSWGRMNPPTAGHEKLINHGEEVAKRMGAQHKVVATRSQDPQNNPLSPDDKLKWLKQFFPGKNLAIAGEDESTIITQLTALNQMGIKDITLNVGADRLQTFQKIFDNYNGQGKPFNFNRWRIISAGSRNEKSDGPEGASGTKVRDAVRKGDYQSYRKGLPSTATEKHAKNMYKDLQKSMKVVVVDKLQKKRPTLGQTVQAAIKEKA